VESKKGYFCTPNKQSPNMAKKNKSDEETIVDVQQVYSKTEHYVEQNKNTLLIIAGILVVLFVGYFAVTRLYIEPRTQEGMEMLWKAEYWFEIDSLDKALAGDESYYGFEYISDEYSSTQAGDLASYYAGIIYMNKGDFQTAISYLEKADLDDAMVGAVAKGAIGDSYVELGNLEKALDYFNQAASHSDNMLTAPLYLKKAGLIHEDLQNFEKALANYKKIKEQYPTSDEARGIESYIARVGG
jgi:tetratricopeptide (TPR) repeat protein